jgi:hypothetical protein
VKTPVVIALVVGGLAVLCCGGLMVAGLLVGEDGSPGSGSGPAASRGSGGGGLEGTWLNGSASLSEYRNTLTGEFAPPSGTGLMYELRSGGDCVHSAMLQATLYSCTSWIFINSDDCSWSLSGNELHVSVGPGTQRSRMCGGQVKEGDSTAVDRTWRVELGEAAGARTMTLTDLSDNSSLVFRAQ